MSLKLITSTAVAALTLFGAATAAAQDNTTTEAKPFFYTGAADRFIEFEAGVGIGASSFMQNYGTEIPTLTDLYVTPGVKVAMGATASFNIRDFLSLCTGLWFNINNSRYSMAILDGNPVTSLSSLYVRNRYYTFEVPVYVSFRCNAAPNVRWQLDAGVYYAHGISGSTKASAYVSGANELGQPVVSILDYDFKYYDSEKALINGVMRTDFGLHLGTGLTFHRHWRVGILTHIGLFDLAKNHGVYNCHYHTIDAQINASYVF